MRLGGLRLAQSVLRLDLGRCGRLNGLRLLKRVDLRLRGLLRIKTRGQGIHFSLEIANFRVARIDGLLVRRDVLARGVLPWLGVSRSCRCQHDSTKRGSGNEPMIDFH